MRRLSRRSTLFSLSLLLNPLVVYAVSEQATKSFHIQAQTLSSALNELAEVADLNVSYPADLASGVNSSGVIGRFSPFQALQKVLSGTGLSYRVTSTGAITLEKVSRQSANTNALVADNSNVAAPLEQTQTLPEMVVEGEREDQESTEKVNRYASIHSSTATKTKAPLLETPASIQVIDQKIMLDKGIRSPNEISEVVAGVQPIVGYGNAASQWFLIRGFNNSALNYRNGYRLREIYTPRDLANVERIEFMKGPASVLYGSNQPGGAVNTITKKPLSTNFITTRLIGGSFGTFRGTVDINQVFGDLGLRLNVAGDRGDSYFDFENSDNWFVSTVLTYQFTPSTKFLYEGEFQEINRRGWANGLPNFKESFRLPFNRTMSEPFTSLDNFNHTHRAELNHSFNEDWRIRQGVYYSRTERSFLSINSDFSRNPGEAANASTRYAYGEPDEHQQNIVAQTELFGHLTIGDFDHELLLGFETSHSIFSYLGDFFTYDTNFNLLNPVYNRIAPQINPTFGSSDTADANAVYLQDQIKWGDWRLLGGWRHDEVDTESRDRISNAITEQSESADTGRVGLLYLINPKTSIYYSFSQSFAPNLGVDFNRNIFEADRGRQHEVGLKHTLASGLEATISLFDLRRSNVVGPDPTHPGFRVNNGEQSSKGVEASLLGRVLPELEVITNLSYLDTEVVQHPNPAQVGDDLFGVPTFSANAWGLYDLPLAIPGKLSVGFGIVHVGDRQATLPNFRLKLPSYTRYDLGLFYKYANVSLTFNLRNLTDEKYFDTLEGFAVQTQPPRNWMLSYGFDF